MHLKLKLGDIFVILIIVSAAVILTLLLYQNNTIAKTAVIIQNNSVLQRIQLDHLNNRVTVDYEGEYPGTIEAENGRIRFFHAECPDQVCVHTGWISYPGQIAVCLPASVIITIEGEESEVDIIVK